MYSKEFLEKLDKLHMRTQYVKIILLNFNEEYAGMEIQGDITQGQISVNGTSAVRRTISFSMLANETTSDIESLENEISVNKKIKVEVGFDNPFKDLYPDPIVWFNCGLFIISTATITRGTNAWEISITGKDKMALLDGSAGGVIPASVTFHEKQTIKDNGDITTEYPTIFQIIFEAVHHWGREPADNIIITDIDDKAKMLVKYVGDKDIYFSDNYASPSFVQKAGYVNTFSYGEDAGYKETDFTYPGELILKPGDTVVTLLDKIKNTLGNYEYFYDLDGRFHFQEIKNYLNTASPVNELPAEVYIKDYNNAKAEYSLTSLDTTTQIARSPNYQNLKNDFYVWGEKEYASGTKVDIRYHLAIDTKPSNNLNQKYMWRVDTGTNWYSAPEVLSKDSYDYYCSLCGSDFAKSYEAYVATSDSNKLKEFDVFDYSALIACYFKQYKETADEADVVSTTLYARRQAKETKLYGTELPSWYKTNATLKVIMEKYKYDRNMGDDKEWFEWAAAMYSKNELDRIIATIKQNAAVKDLDDTLYYLKKGTFPSSTKSYKEKVEEILFYTLNDAVFTRYKFYDKENDYLKDVGPNEIWTLIGTPCNEWREELYRQALYAQNLGTNYDIYYDTELISEWRKLYWPGYAEWDSTVAEKKWWNPDVYNHPENLTFWLDFIDGSTAAIGKYRIKSIGRRTKVINDSSLKTIYNKEVPDILFLENTGYDPDKLAEYRRVGQDVVLLTPDFYELFQISSTGASCFDQIRELLYQNLNYNTQITISCFPRYYLEPNTIIYIEDIESNIKGNYQITQFTLPLAYNGTMTITATEVLTRV